MVEPRSYFKPVTLMPPHSIRMLLAVTLSCHHGDIRLPASQIWSLTCSSSAGDLMKSPRGGFKAWHERHRRWRGAAEQGTGNCQKAVPVVDANLTLSSGGGIQSFFFWGRSGEEPLGYGEGERERERWENLVELLQWSVHPWGIAGRPCKRLDTKRTYARTDTHTQVSAAVFFFF